MKHTGFLYLFLILLMACVSRTASASPERNCDSGVQCFQTGKKILKSDEPTMEDRTKAQPFFAKACEKFEFGKSCKLAGDGTEGESYSKQATAFYETGCFLNDDPSCIRLGFAYKVGIEGKENHKRAVSILEPYCDKDPVDISSCGVLASIYLQEHSRGKSNVNENAVKAAHYLEKACAQFASTGSSSASLSCIDAGRLYNQERGDFEQDKIKAQNFYLLGCALRHKNSLSCTRAGRNYLHGNTVPQDVKKGIAMLELSCAKNQLNACFYLGRVYDKGIHKPKDTQKAAKLYERSCDKEYAHYNEKFARPCLAAADIYVKQKRFSKADILYGYICGDETGEKIECALTPLTRDWHHCYMDDEAACTRHKEAKTAAKNPNSEKKTKKITPSPQKVQIQPQPASKSKPKLPTFNFESTVSNTDKCENISAHACLLRGQNYLMGRNGISVDKLRARSIFKRGCEMENAQACRFVGQTYMSAEYALRPSYSRATARQYFGKACDLKLASGCISVAGTYPEADVYDEDKLPFYKRACEMGHRGGCNAVDRLMETGDYAPR